MARDRRQQRTCVSGGTAEVFGLTLRNATATVVRFLLGLTFLLLIRHGAAMSLIARRAAAAFVQFFNSLFTAVEHELVVRSGKG